MNVKSIIDAGTGIAGTAARQGRDLLKKAQHLRPSAKPEMDDRTLKSKVESVVFRDESAPKGDVNVTVVDRRVTLHGQVKNPATVRALEAAVSAIPEVKGVENMLSLPKTTTRKKPATRSTPRTTRNVNREVKTTSKAEPAPKDLAEKGEGRQPAPLGAKETPETGGAEETPGAKVEAALTSKEAGDLAKEPAATAARGSTKSGAPARAKTTTATAKDTAKSGTSKGGSGS